MSLTTEELDHLEAIAKASAQMHEQFANLLDVVSELPDSVQLLVVETCQEIARQQAVLAEHLEALANPISGAVKRVPRH